MRLRRLFSLPGLPGFLTFALGGETGRVRSFSFFCKVPPDSPFPAREFDLKAPVPTFPLECGDVQTIGEHECADS